MPFLILVPILLLIVADLVRKMFRPITALSNEIDQRSEQELHPVAEEHLPTEVRPFVVAINRLLNRVNQSMESQRRFVADATHELRSPLTAMSLQAERLADTPMPEQARERLATLQMRNRAWSQPAGPTPDPGQSPGNYGCATSPYFGTRHLPPGVGRPVAAGRSQAHRHWRGRHARCTDTHERVGFNRSRQESGRQRHSVHPPTAARSICRSPSARVELRYRSRIPAPELPWTSVCACLILFIARWVAIRWVLAWGFPLSKPLQIGSERRSTSISQTKWKVLDYAFAY